jgi:IS30 family transposase
LRRRLLPGDRLSAGTGTLNGVPRAGPQRRPAPVSSPARRCAADRRAARPKPAKLASEPRLRAVVEAKLRLRWSPEQIAGWLQVADPDDPTMRISPETIYLSLYVQRRGALHRGLRGCLRTGRAMRDPRGRRLPQGRGQLIDMHPISQRPVEVNDRAVAGHWEGDLVLGKRPSAVATLVERTSCFITLVALPDGWRAEQVCPALTAAVRRLPEQLCRSVTWDQGKEMAEHARFTADTGIPVYFCDPRSPWQRASSENANGLLRQYLPRTVDLRRFNQADLDRIAAELNGRLDRFWASRHPSAYWRRRCADPLRPPSILRQRRLPRTRVGRRC